MPNLAAIASRLAHICSWGGQNECSPRTAALCAAAIIAALALALIAWHTPAHADGGSSSARSQPAVSAPHDTGNPTRAYALQILRALTARDSNNWVRYWQARAACHAAAAHNAPAATPLDRALLALTAAICPRLDAHLSVDPADRPPRGDDQTAGLLLNEPAAAAGYTLFNLVDDGKVYLIDPLGRTTHKWHLDDALSGSGILQAKLLDNGNLLILAGALLEIDPRGNIVWRTTGERRRCPTLATRGNGNARGTPRIHHDFLKMPNGNILLLCVSRKTREEAIAAGANPQFVHENGIHTDYLIELRPTAANGGAVVWQWSPWDRLIQDFDPTKPNYGAIADHPERIDINFLLQTISQRRSHAPRDWLHINSIDYNPALDQIMLSPRHFSELWIIDRSPTTQEARGHTGGNSDMGGDLLYRWGNPRAYDHGTLADQRLFWQHQTHWIPPGLPGAGNILLFNNGYEFPGDERGYSSIDEIAPPADGYCYRQTPNAPYAPAKPAWTYVAQTPADFYAPVASGTQRLPNGNTLIADGPAGTISQATPDGKIVWKYIVPPHYHISLWQDAQAPSWLTYGTPDDPSDAIKNAVYRAYFYPPDHPGLQALDLAPVASLEDTPDLLEWARASLTAGDFGQPLTRARYDIYLDENVLIYFKRPCAAEDAQPKFFLHIVPAALADLPADRRERGFANRDFKFADAGKASHDSCIAIAPLPAYPIQSIRTGQFTHAGQLWRAEIDLSE